MDIVMQSALPGVLASLRPEWLFGSGIGLGVVSGFLVFASRASGLSCLTSLLTSCGNAVNYELLDAGLLLGYLAALDIALGFKRRKDGTTFWEMQRQRSARRIGELSMLLGAIPVVLGFFELSVLFDVGLGVVAAGAALVFISRFMKDKAEVFTNFRLLQQKF